MACSVMTRHAPICAGCSLSLADHAYPTGNRLIFLTVPVHRHDYMQRTVAFVVFTPTSQASLPRGRLPQRRRNGPKIATQHSVHGNQSNDDKLLSRPRQQTTN